MELWHLMLIIFVMWGIYGLTKPIIRPTINDIRFKQMIEEQIKKLQYRKIHDGYSIIINSSRS